MNPIKLEGAKIYGAPRDWDPDVDGACIGLPVLENQGAFVSVWKPTATERANIAKGWNIALTCAGGQPPVLLMAVDVQGEIVRFEGDEDPKPEPTIFSHIIDWWADGFRALHLLSAVH
jgi:hypothetical protein